MPHFGLMDEKQLGPVAGPLQRSRLHLRGGRRRLREGKISAGIVTLYDALTAAMESYAARPGLRETLEVRAGEDLRTDADLYRVLARSGVIGQVLDFDGFKKTMEEALDRELSTVDHGDLLRKVETLLAQLEVLPFDESELPPEPQGTF